MAATDNPRASMLAWVIVATAVAALLFGLFRWGLQRTVARQIEASVRTIPGCTGIRYSRLNIPYFSLQCRIHDAALLFDGDAGDIALQMIHIRRFRPGGRLPRVLEAALHGVHLKSSHPLTASLQPWLQRLGYDALTGELQIQWVRQGEKPERWEVDLTLAVADAGDMRLAFRWDKVNMQGVALALDNPLNWLMVLPPIELIDATVTYRDQGLWERLLIDIARQEGRRPEDVRTDLIMALQRQARIENDPAVRAVWQSLERFCRQPGRIIFRTRLAQPLPLGQFLWMRQPEDVIRRLAMEARTS